MPCMLTKKRGKRTLAVHSLQHVCRNVMCLGMWKPTPGLCVFVNRCVDISVGMRVGMCRQVSRCLCLCVDMCVCVGMRVDTSLETCADYV